MLLVIRKQGRGYNRHRNRSRRMFPDSECLTPSLTLAQEVQVAVTRGFDGVGGRFDELGQKVDEILENQMNQNGKYAPSRASDAC